jgi:hypothetical protein
MTSMDNMLKVIVIIIDIIVEIAKIESHLLCYIEPAMKNLKKTNEIFATNFRNKNWELPKIKMEISLDSKEIRPEKIDDW